MDSSATTERPSLDVDAPPTRTILAALASLFVSIPILVLLAQQFGAFGWFAARSDPDRWATPCCDYSALELGTRAFLHGEQWMGLYSRQGWRHPGPAPFLWDSLFRILPGHSFAEHQVAAVVLALLAIAALLAFIWRRASTFAALAGSSVLALWLVRFDVGMLREPWNPIAAMLWVAIFIVCASTFGSVPRSRRARWALLGATVSGSMAAQTHASAMPIVVVSGVVVLVAAWRTRDSMAVRRNLLLAAAGAAVLWVLPLVDLVVGEHGLWRMFTVDEGSGGGFGWSDALRTMVQILGLGPAQQGVRLGPASPYLPTASLTIAQLVLAIIGAALGGYVLMRRRQHPRLAIAVMISFVGLMGTTLLLATSGSAFYPYLLLPVAMCGPMLWICGAIAIAEALLPRMSRITRATASGVAIAALVVLGVIGTLLFYAIEAGERMALPWHVSQRHASPGAGR